MIYDSTIVTIKYDTNTRILQKNNFLKAWKHTQRWNFNHAHMQISFYFSIKPNIFLIVNYTAWLKLHEKTGEKTKETNATATHRDNGET